jgi:cell division septation protein DedD
MAKIEADPSDFQDLPRPPLGVPILCVIILLATAAIASVGVFMFRPDIVDRWTAAADGSGITLLRDGVQIVVIGVLTSAVLVLGYIVFRCFQSSAAKKDKKPPVPPKSTASADAAAASASPPAMPTISAEELAKRLSENKKLLPTVMRISKADLAKRTELWVALRGHVFDVSAKRALYETGGSYRVFVGRDASRAFALGSVKGDAASDDVTGLEPKHVKALDEWFAFYMQRYPLVAVLTDSQAGPI